jgi:hypothetical protein
MEGMKGGRKIERNTGIRQKTSKQINQIKRRLN